MVITSFIFLLLSNTITLRRDKSILYSRVTATILFISAFIAYPHLFFLFLNKGIGIFAGLFSTTATTNVFHIFIFLISSVILLLTSFYPRKVWLKEYSSPGRFLFTAYPSNKVYREYSSQYRLLLTTLNPEEWLREYSRHITILQSSSNFFTTYPSNKVYREYSSQYRLLLTTLNPEEWLREYSRHITILQSSSNFFTIKTGIVTVSVLYGDGILYDSLGNTIHYLSTITDAIDNCYSHLSNLSFNVRPLDPYIKNTYDSWIAMQNVSFSGIKIAVNNLLVYPYFYNFTPLTFSGGLLQFHNNLAIAHYIQNTVLGLLGSLVLIVGVNIKYIFDLSVTVLDLFINGCYSFIKRCSLYYDPARDSYYSYDTQSSKSTSNSKYTSWTINNKVSSTGGGSDDGDDRKNHNNNQPISKMNYDIELTMEQLLRILDFIHRELLHLRFNTIQTLGELEWYGSPTSHNGPNLRASLHHLIRFTIMHPNIIYTPLGIPIGSLLTSEAKRLTALTPNPRTLFQRVFVGSNLLNALVLYQPLRVLFEQQDVRERNIMVGIILFLITRLAPPTLS